MSTEPLTPSAVAAKWWADQLRKGMPKFDNGDDSANGGMADYLLVPHARHLVPLPAGLDPVTAAPLTDAGLTPYHAIRRSWPKLTPDATCVMIGMGGLGHIGVQIARATTAAQVIAVDVKPEALELARKGVTVNAVCPGFTETDIVRESLANIVAKTGQTEAQARDALVAHNPQKKMIQPDEVAQAVMWLCSEAAASVNGQSIAVDGGETM